MLTTRRKDHSGVITIHKAVPGLLLNHVSPRSPAQRSSSVLECPYVPQKSSRVVTRPGTESDQARTLVHCSVRPLQDQFVSERQEADAITQPLLDTENGFIKDLERFLNHSDELRARRHELLHRRWTECVWWPVQRSVIRRHYEGAEPVKTTHTGYDNYSALVSAESLKDPLFLHSRSRMREKRAVLHCQTGCVGCRWVASAEEQSRKERDRYTGSRSQGPVYMADGRCYGPECWSAIGLSRRYSMKP